MRFLSRQPRQSKKTRPSTKLQFEGLESRDLPAGYATAALALVPDTAVNAMAVQSGNWSDPLTWLGGAVPAANANVVIPRLLSVTVDGTTNPVHSVRVDGTLQFATNANTDLLVDTLVVNVLGNLVIGTAANPIAPQNTAAITFTSNGPIDTVWDPNEISRGLLSLGTVSMYGATTTPFVTLAQDASQGSRTLTLSQAPTNWQVGDEIVLGGTYVKQNEDEDLRILAIQGTRVTVSPLAHKHEATSGVPVYLTDVTRNIVIQSQDQTIIGNRGHVMFMSSATSIYYAEFLGLDRTNKSVAANDPQLDGNGNLIPGTGTNPRCRDSVNFYEIGAGLTPAVVDGSTVVGSPGWGFVNHSSNVNFTNDVAFNVNGASFISEAGDEIGQFSNDLAIHSLGTGDEDFYSRAPIQDWAHEGDGFWAQGNGVSFTSDVVVGMAAAGYYYFNRAYTLPVQNVIQGEAPLTSFSGNIADACDYGAFLRYETNGGTIDGLTVVNSITGYKQQYCVGITLQNSYLYGTHFSDYGVFLAVEAATGFVANNVNVSGFPVGIRFSEEYSNQTLTGGTWNNTHNFEIPISIASGRTITITNPTFAPSTHPEHYDIYWLTNFDEVFSRDINTFFSPDYVFYNNNQLFAPWQAASFVPFPRQPTGFPALPTFLIGKTNQQLVASYGLQMGGILAPNPLPNGPVCNGTMGAVVTYPPILRLCSDSPTSQLTGYRLRYRVNDGPTISSRSLYNLHRGWNSFTIRVHGLIRELFVLAT
jgi:hypothetical protein